MDVHRCRFVPYQPSPINAVAFSHATASKNAPVRLAIGHANGNISIWNPMNGLWHQEITLHGGKDRIIDSLVWVTEPDHKLQDGTKILGKSRLFSIGYTTTITEWDLEKGRPKKQASGIHGDIWCLAVQPFVVPSKDGDKGKSKVAQSGTKLVAGTIDGSLVLYSIDDDDLRFDRILTKSSSKKTKMTSIAFQSRHVAVVGCSDSSIRVYNMHNGSILRKMTLGSDIAGGAKEIIVWSVKCLQSGDIVTGDSTGQVCIWDGVTYTQAQRLQSHNQDVLSLATSADGSTIVSGGMDRKTVLYRKISGSGSRWGKVWHRRYHSHDVKTMATFEGLGMSVIVSGGPDASPIVVPLQMAGMQEHRALSHLPQNPPLQSACKSRLIVGWWDREVHVWRLRRPFESLVNASDGEPGIAKNRKLLARILIKGEANITSAAISGDGRLLVVSTTSDVKAFHLKTRDEARRDDLKISKIDLPEKVTAQGATSVQISPDSCWLCLIQEGTKISLMSISQDADSSSKPTIHPKAIRLQRIGRKLSKQSSLGGLGQYDRAVSHIAFSPDSKMLAVADLAGWLDTWVFGQTQPRIQNNTNGTHDDASSSGSSSSSDDDDEDKRGDAVSAPGSRWNRNPNGSLLPRLNSAPTVLSFSNHIPSANASTDDEDTRDDYLLLTITARPQILLVHPSLGSISPWSRRNPISRFPVEFRDTRDLVKGAIWSGDRVWLYGNTFLFMFDMAQDLVEPATTGPSAGMELARQGRKRKRGPDSGAGSKMEKGAVGPTKVTRHVQGQAAEEFSLDGPVFDPMEEDETSQAPEESESEDSDDERQGELALLRGAQGKPPSESVPGRGVAFWHTYKYRPILGIVPLDSGLEDQGEGDGKTLALNGTSQKSLEVALIERPLWEVDMPDRYYGDGETVR
ncbi:Uu.00g035650.m01.CDS01 [Anthostomella pinea]|uniref:Uu.00g035650.m01.CDS01 n=1 Tax=Anthostomella pinea TaxID=933095 RepID=A0AAI8V9X2_9PEZI|nr:Uu.00g035650.m01.CDS01 [Anthostomella pinea]